MPNCEWCNESFDLKEAEYLFENENFMLSYSNIRQCLCGKCAIEAIQEENDGVYFEECEKCGKTFDLIEDEYAFDKYYDFINGTSLRDYWNKMILCADCAIDESEKD